MSTKHKYFGVYGRAATRAVRLRLLRKWNRYISRPRPLKGFEKKAWVFFMLRERRKRRG